MELQTTFLCRDCSESPINRERENNLYKAAKYSAMLFLMLLLSAFAVVLTQMLERKPRTLRW